MKVYIVEASDCDSGYNYGVFENNKDAQEIVDNIPIVRLIESIFRLLYYCALAEGFPHEYSFYRIWKVVEYEML